MPRFVPVTAATVRSEAEPVGWCSVAPRGSYAAIGVSRVIAHLPGDQVWSVTCFFVAPKARHQGLREGLRKAL
jgi:hypothetical protein